MTENIALIVCVCVLLSLFVISRGRPGGHVSALEKVQCASQLVNLASKVWHCNFLVLFTLSPLLLGKNFVS